MSTLLETAVTRRWRVRDDGSQQGPASKEVLCHRGTLYPFAVEPGREETRFVAWTEGSTAVRSALLAVPGARREQGSAVNHGGSELSVSFPNAELDAVARIMRPRQRRPAAVPPSQEVRARGLAALAARRAAV